MTRAATTAASLSSQIVTGPDLLRMAAQERALSRGVRQLIDQTDEPALLQVALEVVSALLPADVVAIYLASDSAGAPRCHAIRHGDDVQLIAPAERLQDDLAAEVVRRNATKQARSWAPPFGEPCRSALAIPLEAQGIQLGAIIVGRHRNDRFRAEHVALLSAACQPLTLALLRLRAERLRRMFVPTTPHEFRTPLSARQRFTELLLSAETPPDVQRDWFNLMNQEAKRLATLIDEMQDISRIKAGPVTLTLAPTQVVDVVSHVVRLLDGDGARVQLVIERTPTVMADADRLVQVVTNLLRNALGYSPAEHPVEVEVAHRCLARQHALPAPDSRAKADTSHICRPSVSVAVRDRGSGITKEELTRVFQPFYRAESSRKLAPEGSGLGLAIVQAIVQRHQGRLWAESRPKRGSTFGFCLNSSDGTD